MPLALLAALAGSLLAHAAALLGTESLIVGHEADQPPALHAVLRPPPAPPPVLPRAKAARQPAGLSPPPLPGSSSLAAGRAEGVATTSTEQPLAGPAEAEVEAMGETAPEAGARQAPDRRIESPAPTPVQAILPAEGGLVFSVYKESLGMAVGRAEQRWSFSADGQYRLTSVTETRGLAALLRPVRQEHESRGRLTGRGLQPEHFHIARSHRSTQENADFDWSTAEVRLSRDDSVHRLAPGTQDLLSLYYQMAYLPNPEHGSSIGVVTGRKVQRHDLDSLGEEFIETPAGVLRTLHLRAAGETLTEIWIALDHWRLPVKIRFTDRKGETYVQILEQFAVEPPKP